MKTRKIIILLTSLMIAAVTTYSQKKPGFKKTDIKQIDKDLTIYLGGGGNSGVLVTDSAVVVIDTKMGADADALYNVAVSEAGGKKIIVINTHLHGDHTKGNYHYKGSDIYIGNYDKEVLETAVGKENMPNGMIINGKTLELGNETVLLYDLGQGHTFHDMVVYLEKRNVLFTGDLVFNGVNPVLKKETGTSVEGWIRSLNEILKTWGTSTIVPGHGPVGDKEIVLNMWQYFWDMKKAVSDTTRETTLKAKYKDWYTMPNLASPDLTIRYIKENP